MYKKMIRTSVLFAALMTVMETQVYAGKWFPDEEILESKPNPGNPNTVKNMVSGTIGDRPVVQVTTKGGTVTYISPQTKK